MTKAFSILHRAAALLVAVCLLVGMALPVYATGDGALFFDADSETIPGESSTTVAENSQNTPTAGLESVSPKVDTVSETDGTSPAEDGSTPPSDTQDQEETVLPDGAPNTDEEPTAEEEPMMLADDFSANDGAGEPAAIAETGEASQGFIPATTTIYFEDDGRYDTYVTDNPDKKCTIRFLVQNICSGNNAADVTKDMTFTGTSDNGHKIFSVTLNSADYPEGGFNRLAFQYYADNEWKEEIYAFGGTSNKTTRDHWTAIDLLAGKKFVRTGDELENSTDHYNTDSSYTPTQWKRVEYCYKGMPLYFKNGSSADLTNVTAVFYKKGPDGTVKTGSQEIGTVGANQFYAQKILIPDNDSQFVQFTWGDNGESALYNFSTEDYGSTTKFDLTKTNCFIYDGTNGSWQSASSDLLTGGKTIYFDATLSSYSYANDPDIHQRAMPGDGESMYCFLTGSDGSTVKTVTMNKVTDTDPATPDRQLYSCQIPPDDGKTYTAVQFSAVNNTTANDAQDNKTKPYSTADIPPTLKEPCFFADDGDPSAYEPNGNAVFRGGYWGEKNSRHDAESGKGSTVVDIASGKFTQQKGIKYITSTLYDYYTDYELNGFNRDGAPSTDGSSQRRFVTFEQFDRALSSAYTKKGNVKYPLYTGHFEPTDGGALFATVAGGMNLCGWGKPNGTEDQRALYNTFMAVNNSAYNDKGDRLTDDSNNYVYDRTFQGLVEKKASANGLPLLRAKDSITENALVDPHFNEDFLQGYNSFNTVLGKVYKDVSFPFTKDAVFKSEDTSDPEQYANYWYYDSSKASLYLKQDQTNGKYYLESPKNNGKPITDDHSKNMYPSGGATHGFFPFNETVPSNANAAQYNYGFGAKLQFDFTLTENGKVVVKDASGKDTTVPIKFFFSGDDDVWVYIDGDLVLDVGGAHGKASGLLEFGAGSTVTPYVSSNKNTDNDNTMAYKTPASKTVYFNKNPIKFTKTTDKPTQLDKNRTTHTLTMFYMERGMWDSNMAVAFNFPDSNQLQVEKEVNVDNVNEKFKDLFKDKDQKLFTFTLQNLATHYGAKPIDDNDTPTRVEVGSKFTTSSSPTVHTKMEQGVSPSSSDSEEDKAKTVMWYAQGNDNGSQHRDLRYGTMTLNSPLDIKNRDYLSFDVYAVGGDSDGILSTNYLYLTLEDDKDNQMGCDLTNGKKSYLNTMLSGSVVMQNNQWVTVKLQLSKMPQDDGFDLTKLSKIRIGDDYERTVYFRNFVFTAKPVVNTTVGFSVEQKDIRDYGSVDSKTLMPASGAIFTSSVAINGTQAVDTDGTFDLQAGETVTFTDQFRRGSYISLQEAENTALYSTRWEVYENGTLVSTAEESSSVSGTITTSLQGKDTKPNDGRTEKTDSTTVGYDGTKPANANTLVFRSYAAPEEEFPKLKVKFINTVKVGTLVIKKEQPSGEAALTDSYHFTVTFSNVGGIGLGGADGKKMTKDLAVGDSWTITGIPIGTRFRVVETPADGSSLQDVTCNAADAKYDVDNGVRGTVTSETEQVTATFTNTAHQLMDIEVEKKWLDANDTPLTNNLPDAIWVKLERRAGTDDTWQDATSAVELKYDYMSKTWTHTFKRLDKTDVNGTGTPEYVYRVVECASETGTFTAAGTVTIGTYTYTASQTTLTDGKITLTNQRTDPKFALNLTKMGIDGATETLLGGVEFKLEKLKADNTVETTYNGTTGSDGAKTGELTFADLTPGKYRLTETKTAEGYTLLSEAIEFELTADGKCQRGSTGYDTVNQDPTSGVYNIALTIYNRKGFTLPHTGADAPSLWLLLGLPALTAVLLVLVFRYKKGRRS